MRRIPPDQITMECMDCSRRYVGPRPETAPASAVLFVVHCGCNRVSTPFYIDAEGELIEQLTRPPGPGRGR
jgi:hypothetical protein